MSIKLFMLGDEFYNSGKELDDLSMLKERIIKGVNGLKSIPIQKFLEIFQAFSLEILHSKELQTIEGVAFVSQWVRKSNFEKILNENLGNVNVLDNFVNIGNKYIKAQPKGVVVHWVAGNIQTLALFSLFQSMIVRNANILRLPLSSIDNTLKFLKIFSGTKCNGVTGKQLLESVAVVYVPSSNKEGNEALSKIADVRVIWGGENAVKDIRRLATSSHCEDIIFGPKYSFAVVDKNIIDSNNFNDILRNFAIDIIFAEQISCTSPHVIFFETDSTDLEKIAHQFAKEFEIIAKRHPRANNAYVSSLIATKRAEYRLMGKKIICSKDMDCTIIIDNDLKLENPIGYRTIFIKPVNSIFDIIPLITKRIQTIGCAVYDKDKMLKFADAVSYLGVSRCVPAGTMNFYDSPWDGIYPINRLITWNSLKFTIK